MSRADRCSRYPGTSPSGRRAGASLVFQYGYDDNLVSAPLFRNDPHEMSASGREIGLLVTQQDYS